MGQKKETEVSLGFYHYAEADSPDGILGNYLNEHRLTKKLAMLEAVRTHWLPLALKDAGVTGSELEEAGMESVCAMRSQIDLICALLDLDRARLGLSGGMVLQQAPATTTGNGGGGDSGGETETEEERALREYKEKYKVPEYTRGSGFEDWG